MTKQAFKYSLKVANELNKYKIIALAFIMIAILLSNIMSAKVAFEYSSMLWGIKYAGYSAPANVAFLLAVPYAIGILACIILSVIFWRKSSQFSHE